MKVTLSRLKDFLSNPEAYGSVLLHGNDYDKTSLYTQKILDYLNRSAEYVVHKTEFTKASREPEQLFVDLMTVPMFHQKSLILLTDAKDTLPPELKTAIENAHPQYCYTIIQAKELSNASSLKSYYNNHARFASIGCYKEDNVNYIVAEFLSEHNISYDSAAFKLLRTLLQNSNASLHSELDKLLLYLGETKNLTVEDVQKSFTADLDPALDDVCVAIAEGDLLTFLKVTDALFYNKVSPILIIRSSLKYFMRLEYVSRKVNSGNDADEVIKSIQPPVFFKIVPKLKRHLSLVSYQTLRVILRKLFEAEIQCKLLELGQEVVFKYLMLSLITYVKNTQCT